MRMDEQELMQQIQEGNEMAFAQIITAYKDRIVNYLYQFTGDYQKAVELSQETFIRVYFKANKYRPIAPLSSWIYAIATNLARTEMKKARRASLVSLEDLTTHEFQENAYAVDPPDPGLIKNLREALNSLHPRYRLPVILKDMEGFSQEEIAQILKKPVGTIKARISRGRHFLKKRLERALVGRHPSARHEERRNG
jgi:RNA polymerase sigma-70 factor (ECF subfamily)